MLCGGWCDLASIRSQLSSRQQLRKALIAEVHIPIQQSGWKVHFFQVFGGFSDTWSDLETDSKQLQLKCVVPDCSKYFMTCGGIAAHYGVTLLKIKVKAMYCWDHGRERFFVVESEDDRNMKSISQCEGCDLLGTAQNLMSSDDRNTYVIAQLMKAEDVIFFKLHRESLPAGKKKHFCAQCFACGEEMMSFKSLYSHYIGTEQAGTWRAGKKSKIKTIFKWNQSKQLFEWISNPWVDGVKGPTEEIQQVVQFSSSSGRTQTQQDISMADMSISQCNMEPMHAIQIGQCQEQDLKHNENTVCYTEAEIHNEQSPSLDDEPRTCTLLECESHTEGSKSITEGCSTSTVLESQSITKGYSTSTVLESQSVTEGCSTSTVLESQSVTEGCSTSTVLESRSVTEGCSTSNIVESQSATEGCSTNTVLESQSIPEWCSTSTVLGEAQFTTEGCSTSTILEFQSTTEECSTSTVLEPQSTTAEHLRVPTDQPILPAHEPKTRLSPWVTGVCQEIKIQLTRLGKKTVK